MQFYISKTNINTSKDVNEANIVCISDLHYEKTMGPEFLKALKDKIKELNPKYICFLGDLTNSLDYEDIYWWLEELGKITKVYIAMGNHDRDNKMCLIYSKGKVVPITIFDILRGIDNVSFLVNQVEYDENFAFHGVPFFDDELISFVPGGVNQLSSKYNEKTFNVLLSHNPLIMKPDTFNYFNPNIRNNTDLILSGHMHNGMMPNFLNDIVPGTTGIYTKNNGLFPKYVRGKIDASNNESYDNAHFQGFILPALKTLPEKNKAFETANKKIYKPAIKLIRIKNM